jgi:glycosyl transferase family 2/methyltransferase family protein
VSAVVEVHEVAAAPVEPGLLLGSNIEHPKPGAVVDGATITIVGWVLGRASPATSVEVVSEDEVVERIPVREPRPDLAAAFPQAPDAGHGGFRTKASVVGRAQLDLELRAVLEDGARVPLAAVRARRRLPQQELPEWAQLVSVVVTARDQAADLADCLDSLLAQTYPHFEVVVVDEGSADNTVEVARRYAGVGVLECDGDGVARARNAGLAATRGAFVVFVSAADRLLPQALERGLAEFDAHPECAFVAGLARVVGDDPGAAVYPQQPLVPSAHYEMLLQGNYILSHAAVTYRRMALSEVGHFDPHLPALSEYDLYLRVAREFPVGCFAEEVVEDRTYARREDAAEEMLRAGGVILGRQRRHVGLTGRHRVALDAGERRWRERWGAMLAEQERQVRSGELEGSAGRQLRALGRLHPEGLSASERERRPALHPVPLVGAVDFGDLRRLRPLSDNFGYDRGTPIDRYYIENHLDRHRDDVRGRVLEVQEDAYTSRYGGDRVTAREVLSRTNDNPRATIFGDLEEPGWMPERAFDCAIVTQTLHLVYDCPTALATLHKSLVPGGVLLLTTPGVSQVEWGEAWQWGFTVPSLAHLLEDAFGPGNVAVKSHGNVLAATAFLQGIAVEELDEDELDHIDLCYPLVLAARAVKGGQVG